MPARDAGFRIERPQAAAQIAGLRQGAGEGDKPAAVIGRGAPGHPAIAVGIAPPGLPCHRISPP